MLLGAARTGPRVVPHPVSTTTPDPGPNSDRYIALREVAHDLFSVNASSISSGPPIKEVKVETPVLEGEGHHISHRTFPAGRYLHFSSTRDNNRDASIFQGELVKRR